MPRDYKVYLQDILEATERILRYTAGASDFTRDERTMDAVLRNLEVIGEAAKGVPPAFRAVHPEGVDAAIIRDVVKNKLPGLKRSIRSILGRKGGLK